MSSIVRFDCVLVHCALFDTLSGLSGLLLHKLLLYMPTNINLGRCTPVWALFSVFHCLQLPAIPCVKNVLREGCIEQQYFLPKIGAVTVIIMVHC